MTDSRTSNPSTDPPGTDLETGTVHVCTLADGTRILCRGDLLILWHEGEQASMTGKQWLGTLDEIERRRIEADRYDTAIASRDLEIERLLRKQQPSAFEQSSPRAYVDGLAPETGLGQPDRLIELENEVAEAHDLISEFDSEIASGNVPDRLGDLFEKLRPSQKANEVQESEPDPADQGLRWE